MPKRLFSLSDRGAGWSANRRVLVVAVVLAALLAVAGLAAWSTGRSTQDNPPSSGPAPAAPGNSSPSQDAREPGTGTGSVPRPPRISDPVAYAKAAAEMLWSYDTRDTGHEQQLAGMQAWVTKESQYSDWASVSAQMPDPILWSRMADQRQHATASVTEGHYPSAFKQALAEDPSAITEAYIYAVTVTGRQRIAWTNGGSGAEDRSVTLAVQCRPSQDCSLVAVAPRVAP